MDVALFVPCYVDQLAPDVAMATLQLLERVGCVVHYDPDQSCCGQPFITTGARRQAARLARLHLERFSGFDTVVSPSASCVSTLRAHYSSLLGSLTPAQQRSVVRTYELGEFLVRELGVTDLGAHFPHRVGLLQSCHGLRQLGLGTPSEQVLPDPPPGSTESLVRAVRGLQLVELDRPDECCGFGGAFSVEFPELSTRIGFDRLRAFQEAGAEYITGTDVSCLLHLDGLRRREGWGPRVIHLAELLLSRGPAGPAPPTWRTP